MYLYHLFAAFQFHRKQIKELTGQCHLQISEKTLQDCTFILTICMTTLFTRKIFF